MSVLDTRVLLVLSLPALAIVLLPPAVAANGAPVRLGPGPGIAGTVAPIASDQIRLVEEQVDLEIYPLYTVGRVRYVLRNEGAATEIDFGFPTATLSTRKKPEGRGFIEYEIAVNGQPQESRTAPGEDLTKRQALDQLYRFDRVRSKLTMVRRQTPGKIEYSPFTIEAADLFRRVRTARWEYRITPLRFAAGEQKQVAIEFIAYNLVVSAPFNIWHPHGTLNEGFYYFCYLTRPAAAWKDTIGKADFRVTLYGSPPWTERWSESLGPVADPEPHARAGNVLEWHFEQWEPAKDIRVMVPFAIEQIELSRGVLERYGDSIVHPSEIAAVDASSTINPRTRSARKAFDGNLKGTAWVSGQSKTKGAGETISVKLASRLEIRGVGIVPGYPTSRSKFEKIGRPKTLSVSTDGGFTQTFDLEDRAVFPFIMHTNMQVFNFAESVTTSKLSFEIVEVFPGRLSRPKTSVAVSEIVLFKALPEKETAPVDHSVSVDGDETSDPDEVTPDAGTRADAGHPVFATADRGPRGCSCAAVAAQQTDGGALLLLLVVLAGLMARRRMRAIAGILPVVFVAACGSANVGEVESGGGDGSRAALVPPPRHHPERNTRQLTRVILSVPQFKAGRLDHAFASDMGALRYRSGDKRRCLCRGFLRHCGLCRRW